MKKILTLLLLSAFFAMPRSVDAVYWKTATGNEYRINPENPADPNDSILIPAGTRYIEIFGVHYKNGNVEKDYIQLVEMTDIFVDRYLSSATDTIKIKSLRDIAFSEESLNCYNRNFMCHLVLCRIARIFGYTYYLDHLYPIETDWIYFSEERRYVRESSKQKVIESVNYLRKCILTEEEILNTKKIDLDAEKYRGGSYGGGSIKSLDGLQIFSNLEELNISYSELFSNHNYDRLTGRGFFTPQFIEWLEEQRVRHELDPNVFVPNIPLDSMPLNRPLVEYGGIASGSMTIDELKCRNYIPLFLRCFPKLRTLICRNMIGLVPYDGDPSIGSIKLDLSPKSALHQLPLEYLDLHGSGIDIVCVDSFTNLQYFSVENCYRLVELSCDDADLDSVLATNCPKLNIMKCRRNNLKDLDLTGCVSLTQLYCGDNALESLTLDQDAYELKRLECQNNNLTELSFPGKGVMVPDPEYYFDSHHGRSYWWELDKWVCYDESIGEMVDPYPLPFTYVENAHPALGGALEYLDCSKNNLTTLSLPNTSVLKELHCWNNKLTELDLSDCESLWRLRMSNNKVKSLDLSNNLAIKDIYCNSNAMDSLKGFADLSKLQYFQANNNNFTELDCSGIKDLREFQVSRNKIKALDFSNNSYLHTVICDAQGGKTADGRLLRTLKVNDCPSLTKLICNDNAILSLNLTASTSLTPDRVEAWTQRGVEDVKVLDHDKICIELPNGVMKPDGQAAQFQTWTTGNNQSGFNAGQSRTITRNGMTYLVLYDISNEAVGDAQTKADVDYYGNKKRYHYTIWDNNLDETLGKSVAKGYNNDNITVTIYPYVMYVNPTSADIHSVGEGNAPFYSGTIYLDYDAIVPEGTTVYIAKKIKIRKEEIYSTPSGGHEKVVADQLQLVPLVPGEGATEVVIPAYTPVYVKSATETGLFSFDRNNHGGVAQPLGVAEDGSHLITDNIFKGALTDSAVTKYSVLALGRGRPAGSGDEGYTTQSRIGFWPSSRTVIPAHRVFIPIGELENAGVNSSSPGLLFSFINDIDENTTTGIRSAVINKNEGWYTINGVRLNGRPTEKGIYIHNGRKEVIR